MAVIKGAQAYSIFESVFFLPKSHKSDLYGYMTWGLAKELKFRKLECLFEGFRYEYIIKHMISMHLITKKIQDSQKKVVWDALGTLMKVQERFLKFFVF